MGRYAPDQRWVWLSCRDGEVREGARDWCDSCAFWGGPVVAEGGLHQVELGEGGLQPPMSRHTSTIVHRHTSNPTTPKPYYLAPARRATPIRVHAYRSPVHGEGALLTG